MHFIGCKYNHIYSNILKGNYWITNIYRYLTILSWLYPGFRVSNLSCKEAKPANMLLTILFLKKYYHFCHFLFIFLIICMLHSGINSDGSGIILPLQWILRQKLAVFHQKGGLFSDSFVQVTANHGQFLCSDDAEKPFRRPRNGVQAASERS